MKLVRYVGSRLAQGVLVVVGAIIITFLIANLSGNPSDVIGGNLISPQQRAEIKNALGYDDPVLERLGSYLTGALHGNFGTSWRTGNPALTTVMSALPETALLIVCAMALALLLAVPFAFLSVLNRDSRFDRSMRVGLMFMGALPDFWVALLLVLLFSVNLNLLPSIGFGAPTSLIMPSLALALPLVPTIVRLLRGSLLDVVEQDFVIALRAKGFSDRFIVTRHGFKNASVPFITLIAMQVGWLLGGTLIVEVIFGWPGLGSLLQDAVQYRDLALVQATVVVVACGYVLVNLAADLCAVFIDPRIRLGR